jgi:hypothetical protein
VEAVFQNDIIVRGGKYGLVGAGGGGNLGDTGKVGRINFQIEVSAQKRIAGRGSVIPHYLQIERFSLPYFHYPPIIPKKLAGDIDPDINIVLSLQGKFSAQNNDNQGSQGKNPFTHGHSYV